MMILLMKWRWLIVPGALILAGCSMDTAEVRPKGTDNGAGITLDYQKKEDQGTASQSGSPTSKQSDESQQKSNQSITPSLDMHGKQTYAAAPAMQIDSSKQYTATIKTALGDIDIRLHAKETPITVNNFIFLAREKFYDNVIFHRTIPGFMIQGGDPTGTGAGGPGYTFNDEAFTGDYKRGIVAMANAGANTNGSQFFIMHADAALPKNYVIFGEVTAGMDVVDKIATAPTQPGGEGSKPVTPVEIRTVEIAEGK